MNSARVISFTKAYVKSMRLYYSFVTGIAGWLGVAYYEFIATQSLDRTTEIAPSAEKKMVILALLFLSWGINQIINDYLGLKECSVQRGLGQRRRGLGLDTISIITR